MKIYVLNPNPTQRRISWGITVIAMAAAVNNALTAVRIRRKADALTAEIDAEIADRREARERRAERAR